MSGKQPESQNLEKSIGIVVLAAGGSSRLGTPKQLLSFDGETLLRRAVTTALQSGNQPIVVVAGAQYAKMCAELAGIRVHLVENEQWQDGMASSVRCGLNALLRLAPDVDAAMFMLCDQPLLTSKILRDLGSLYRDTSCVISACRYAGEAGVPALFDRSLFPELLSLKGSQGAKRVIAAHALEVGSVEFPEGQFDIDTFADYERLVNHHSRDT